MVAVEAVFLKRTLLRSTIQKNVVREAQESYALLQDVVGEGLELDPAQWPMPTQTGAVTAKAAAAPQRSADAVPLQYRSHRHFQVRKRVGRADAPNLRLAGRRCRRSAWPYASWRCSGCCWAAASGARARRKRWPRSARSCRTCDGRSAISTTASRRWPRVWADVNKTGIDRRRRRRSPHDVISVTTDVHVHHCRNGDRQPERSCYHY